MKKIILVILICSPQFLFAKTSAPQFDIKNTDRIDLQMDVSSATFGVLYPGSDISGLCGVEIRADSFGREKSIQTFLDSLEVVKTLGVFPKVSKSNDMTITIDLSDAVDSFGTWFLLKTKSGQTFRDVIVQTLGEGRTVVLIGKTCDREPNDVRFFRSW